MPQKNNTLTIGKATKGQLTKNQLAFNTLTQKIEKLRKDIENKHLLFDETLKVFSAKVHPLQAELTAQRIQLVKALWHAYKSHPLAKPDQKHLRHLLQEQLHEVLQHITGQPDEELKLIFRELEGENYDTVLKREEDMMKSQMQDMFDDYDLDIDLGSMDINDPQTVAEKMAEAQQKIREKQQQEQERRQQRQQKQRKTAKQTEQEKTKQAVDELKQKNISTIYKQLAKLFHPDLEQDELRRAEKEVLMKELTMAYEAKNLHALLMLELQWIHKETDHLENLTEEKLSIYLQILREQAQQLEQEKYQIPHQPRYSVLMEHYGMAVAKQPLKTVEHDAKKLAAQLRGMQVDVEEVKSSYGLRHIKALIKQWKQAQQMNPFEVDEDEELIRMMFGR